MSSAIPSSTCDWVPSVQLCAKCCGGYRGTVGVVSIHKEMIHKQMLSSPGNKIGVYPELQETTGRGRKGDGKSLLKKVKRAGIVHCDGRNRIHFFFFFNGCTHSIWKFPHQGLHLSHSSTYDAAGTMPDPLIRCSRLGIEPPSL